MISEWKEIKLKEFASINMGQSPKSEYYNNEGIGLPFLQGNRTFGVRYPSIDTYCSEPKKIANSSEILFSVRAPVGDINIANQKICIGRGLASLNALNGGNIFLYYLLHYLKREILNSEGGTVFGSINRTDLGNVNIVLSPLPEQRAIASVLSSLDDKIDLLHLQNKTLEAMAETLFRQWFVEEAKEGWKETVITEFFEIRDGTHDSPKQSPVGKPLITSKYIGTNRLDIKKAYLISEDDFYNVNKRSKVETNDILFSMIGTIGLTYLEQSETVDYAIKNIGLFKTSQNPDWRYYTFLWINSSLGKEFIHEHRSGSTQEYIALGSLRSIVFDAPPLNLLLEFNKVIHAYFQKIKNNMFQIRTLEKLRDTLLPKLMSGEVRVEV